MMVNATMLLANRCAQGDDCHSAWRPEARVIVGIIPDAAARAKCDRAEAQATGRRGEGVVFSEAISLFRTLAACDTTDFTHSSRRRC